ncbi:MAG: DUF2807 domain-containing protein [Bacteroidota bacterium]
MKTFIKNFIPAVLTLAILIGSSIYVSAADNTITVLSEVKKVNKINVAGNVELILVQSADESVKVYDSYYAKNALVQQKDGELRISSYNKEPLTVVVYVANLNAITASNNATVKTYGKFSALGLSINLNDNATANLNTNTINLATNIKDNASLTLTGFTSTYDAMVNGLSKVNMSEFVAENTNIRSQNVVMAAKISPTPLSAIDDLYTL